mgnify:CR=1 FL=1
MKFGTINLDGKSRPVVAGSDGTPRLLSDACGIAGVPAPATVLELVESAADDAQWRQAIAASADRATPITGPIDWAPPLTRPSKIIGVAFNNRELVKKAHIDPGVPNFFLKPPSSLTGQGHPICVDPAWGAVIPEPEVCAVIGRRAKNVSEEDALSCIFGYSIMNDVTSHGLKFGKDSIAITYDPDMARPEFYKWRHLHGDDDRDAYYVYHTRSKGTDTFGPMGPWLITRDEIDDIDGEVFAEDHTSNYRFSIQACVAEASRYFTLEPGDVITFGTTGKGKGRFPRGHKNILIGEMSGTIGIEVEGIGRLENPIVHIGQ